MPSHSIYREEDGIEYEYTVEFEVTSWGSPAHMGSLNYPGHPAEPPEIEIERIFKTNIESSAKVKLTDDELDEILDWAAEQVLDHFDFSEYSAYLADEYAEYRYERD